MDIFVARQPIFDQRERVFAYELLFRDADNNHYDSLDGDQATLDVIANSFLVIGMPTLTRGKRAFINFTANLLKKHIADVLPKEWVAVEVLETVEPDLEIIHACKQLKQSGHLLVLDDFVFAPKYWPLIELADVIKVDFLNTGPGERQEIVRRMGSRKIKFLAEKVETREDFQQAAGFGYSLFQGNYFCKPMIVSGKDIPFFKLNYLKLLQEINSPQVELDKIETIIKMDVALSYKLLKFINSSAFAFNSQVHSIKQALMLLGLRDVRKWASLLSLRMIGQDKPDELVVTTLIRAIFGEAIGKKTSSKQAGPDIFLMGMFSTIDAFLDRSLADALAELPIINDIKIALLGEENSFGLILKTIIAYERADWENLSHFAVRLGLKEEEIPVLYMQSLKSANEIIASLVS